MDWLQIILTLLASALGGALVAGGFGLYTLKKNKDTEHAQWLRNEKIKRYADYMEALNIEPQALAESAVASVDRSNRVMLAFAMLQLVAPNSVLGVAQTFKAEFDKTAEIIKSTLPEGLQKGGPAFDAVVALLRFRVSMADAMRADLKVRD